MLTDGFQKALERDAIVKILARMNLVREIDAFCVELIKYRPPAAREFREALLDESWRPLGPRIEVRPQQRAGKRRMSSETKMAARTRGEAELLDRPLLARRGATTQLGWCESVKQGIEGGMDRDQLALQMRREFGDLYAMCRESTRDLVAVGLAARRVLEIKVTWIPARKLDSDIAERGGPLGDRVQAREGRFVVHKLREIYGGASDGLHIAP